MSTNDKSSQEQPEQQKQPLRVAVLVSGSGSNLQALIDASEGQQLPGVEIVLVVSNKADATGLQRALKHKIAALFLPWKNRVEAEARLIALLHLFQTDLIVLAGWMRIFSPEFITEFQQRIINLHPALLPADGTGNSYVTRDGTMIPVFRGLHAVRQALAARVTITGTTVHYVTPEVDAGPVICREEVIIDKTDTEDTLHERIKAVEHRLIVQAVKQYAALKH